MISADKLLKFAPNIKDAAGHAAALEKARLESTVDNVRRLAAFLGQIYVETAGMTVMEENLNYRNPERLDALFSRVRGTADARALIAKGPQAIANRVYGGRDDLGNGDEASGDGWKYRGSGYKQLTGRYNYREMGRQIGMDLENHPDWVRVNPAAAQIAFAFWDARRCSPLADVGDIEAITERVNGPARLALAARRAATARALDIWSD
jgi:putative chitinase